MANIPTYRGEIRVPDVAPAPPVRPVDNGLADVAAGVRMFAGVKLQADRAASLQDARIKAVTGLDTLAQQLEREPDYKSVLQRYDASVQALRAEIEQGLDGDGALADFGNDFTMLAHARRLSLGDAAFRRETDSRVAELHGSLADFSRRAAAAPSTAEYAAITHAAEKNIADMAAGGYLTASAAQALREKFLADTDEVSAMQAIEKNPAAAAELLRGADAFPALDPERRVRLRLHAGEEVKARAREAQARASEAAAIARSSLSDAMQVIRSGLPADPSLLQTAAAAARASGRPELVEGVREAADLAIWQNKARLATPVQLREELGALARDANERGANPAAAAKFTLGRELLSTMSAELSRDPLSWAQRQGRVEIAPVSFASADADTMGARAGAAHAVAGYYGISPRFFTGEERASLKQTLAEAPAQTQLALATSIVKGFGKDAPAALGEISGDAPLFAHLGGLLAMGPQHAAAVEAGFLGARAMAEKNDVVPGGARLDSAVSSVLGGALDERLGGTRAAAISAAKAIYTAEALQRGLTAADFDESIFETSLQRALGQWTDGNGDERGGVAALGGRDVVLPVFMTAGDLKDTLRGLTDENLAALSARGGAPVHADGTPFTAGELRDAWLVSLGPGLYQISLTDPGRQARELVMDGGSRGYFVLDLSSEQRLAAAGVKPVTRWQKLWGGGS